MEKKKKKVIKDITFDHENGHVALVGPAVGGPANKEETILLKANSGFTKEIIEKATQIQVTLSIEEYLYKFWNMYYPDAEALAIALGFTVEASEKEQYDYAEDYRKYLDEKIGSIEIIKSLKNGNTVEILSEITGDEYLSLLTDQEMIEKAIFVIEEAGKPAQVKVKKSESKGETDESKPQPQSVEQPRESFDSITNKNRKQTMTTKEVKTVVADVEKDLVEKSAYDAIQKSLDEQKLELTKALEQVELFKQEKKLVLVKSRKDKLSAVVKNKEQSEVLFKALGLVESDAEFEEVLKAISDIQKLADQSELFKSVGSDGSVEDKSTPSFADSLKARAQAQYKK
jgi:hypothetical protein